jgi:hypothetical protein
MVNDDPWRDWAAIAAGKIRSRQSDPKLKSRNLLAEKDLKEKKAPELWSQVQREIKNMCDSLNRQFDQPVLDCSILEPNEAIVKAQGGSHTIKAGFDPQTLDIKLHEGNILEVYSPTIVQNDEVVFSGHEGKVIPRDIAKRFVESIVVQIR